MIVTKIKPSKLATKKVKERIREHGPLVVLESIQEVGLSNVPDDSWHATFSDGHKRWIRKEEIEFLD